MSDDEFLRTLWSHYADNNRHLPWRVPENNGRFDFYKISVSELMLQQTQVSRVIPKFEEFIERFPTYTHLAEVSFSELLQYWTGLGYNRRALYLHEWAKGLVTNGLPTTAKELTQYRGFGANTAAAVFVYSYNEPLIFIETNVRSVLLYHFFSEQVTVSDAQIAAKLETLLDKENPREFYWALMDYGTYLKANHKNLNHRSAHYSKQSPFIGSRRQLRGVILRYMQHKDRVLLSEIINDLADTRTKECIDELTAEGFIKRSKQYLSLSK